MPSPATTTTFRLSAKHRRSTFYFVHPSQRIVHSDVVLPHVDLRPILLVYRCPACQDSSAASWHADTLNFTFQRYSRSMKEVHMTCSRQLSRTDQLISLFSLHDYDYHLKDFCGLCQAATIAPHQPYSRTTQRRIALSIHHKKRNITITSHQSRCTAKSPSLWPSPSLISSRPKTPPFLQST